MKARSARKRKKGRKKQGEQVGDDVNKLTDSQEKLFPG
jgi:hypothetical protein